MIIAIYQKIIETSLNLGGFHYYYNTNEKCIKYHLLNRDSLYVIIKNAKTIVTIVLCVDGYFTKNNRNLSKFRRFPYSSYYSIDSTF